MKRLVYVAFLLFLSAGCAPREARYLDEEFGKAQLAAWDRQIVNHESSDTPPEGFEGISAEEVMNVYNDTFAEKPTRTAIPELGKKISSGK